MNDNGANRNADQVGGQPRLTAGPRWQAIAEAIAHSRVSTKSAALLYAIGRWAGPPNYVCMVGRDVLMRESGIGTKDTYAKAIRELSEFEMVDRRRTFGKVEIRLLPSLICPKSRTVVKVGQRRSEFSVKPKEQEENKNTSSSSSTEVDPGSTTSTKAVDDDDGLPLREDAESWSSYLDRALEPIRPKADYPDLWKFAKAMATQTPKALRKVIGQHVEPERAKPTPTVPPEERRRREAQAAKRKADDEDEANRKTAVHLAKEILAGKDVRDRKATLEHIGKHHPAANEVLAEIEATGTDP